MRRIALLLSLAALPGCIGSFALTDKLLTFNRGLGSLAVQEVVFLAFCIVPVYEVTVLVDAVVLNIVEAASGTNPIASTEPRRAWLADGSLLEVSRRGRQLGVVLARPDGTTRRHDIVRDDGRWTVVDEAGAVLIVLEPDGRGGARVVDGAGQLVASYGTEAVAEAAAAIATRDGARLRRITERAKRR